MFMVIHLLYIDPKYFSDTIQNISHGTYEIMSILLYYRIMNFWITRSQLVQLVLKPSSDEN